MPTLEERFWAKVDVRAEDECWEWQASTTGFGYGQMGASARGASPLMAHRVSYEMEHGESPGGLDVCHICDNPPCVNPAHLFLGTRKDNMRDCVRKGRMWRPGHPSTRLTPEQVREIRAKAETGASSNALAREYPVTGRNIRRIIRRELWTHV